MSISVRLNLIVFQATDRSIDFQDGESHIAALANSMLAQGALQFVHADMLFFHVRFDDFSVMNQKAGMALHDAPEPATGAGKCANQIVQQ